MPLALYKFRLRQGRIKVAHCKMQVLSIVIKNSEERPKVCFGIIEIAVIAKIVLMTTAVISIVIY